MSGLLVARRSGIGTAPDGTKYRIARGKTIADPRHPLVLAYPNDWMAVEVSLQYDGDEVNADPDNSEIAAVVARAEAAEVEAGAYRAQLEAVVEVLHEHGYTPPGELVPGWLAVLVDEAVTETKDTGDDEPLASGGIVQPGHAYLVGEQDEAIEPAVTDGPPPEAVEALKSVAAPTKPRKRAPRAAS